MNPFGAERLAAKKVGKVDNDEIKEFVVCPTDLWFSNYTQWSCEYSLESTGESSGNGEWGQVARHWSPRPVSITPVPILSI